MKEQYIKTHYWRHGPTVWKANFICKSGSFEKISDSTEIHETYPSDEAAEQFLTDLYKRNSKKQSLGQTTNTLGCIF